MKRLFEVKFAGVFFESKKDAKEYCKENGGHVSIGPDHWRHDLPKKTHEKSRSHRQGQGHGDGFPRKKRR